MSFGVFGEDKTQEQQQRNNTRQKRVDFYELKMRYLDKSSRVSFFLLFHQKSKKKTENSLTFFFFY